ncbi:MAG: ISL3 family transposase [Candidatus Thiodiazotropha sp. (ex Lucinoma aequizonata)]|nr:ISL3 family transposase [Candidatus Thiodiazotropha sp. (ex Lucinoma aequizonata)]MCU7887518.1 ISL3 family transposase [Candidatus Thiodiazotropha sp. (ex Lucinoma aequizonata)]MCU7896239.1 ISL3 family transposase [Candidatus Thiodiazotropha sp. (ex Lucinoma aequizonata)]MCU7899005.1 ISL3 family transposase [Candidatus Thiodiazotropha sp. (ex Lucinoma aequizonata)]MCU7904029.1 ISL3 family transposase [Candidatus Thiodiazotropha sp. (ex Lucinoma aequizonata)]
MQIKTILNQVQKFKSFVYGTVRLVEDVPVPTLEIKMQPRSNSRPICSGCGYKRPGYDRSPERLFEFVPMWGYKVFFRFAPRRVDCPDCGVRVERMPWVVGKHRLTESYVWYLASWTKRLSWKEVAEAFRTTWDHVFCSVEQAVTWGREHQDLSGVKAIGVDEIAWQRGHRYLTLVYQIDEHNKRLLWIGEKRTVKTLLRFFRWFGKERSLELKFVCSDMWKPYLKVIAKKAGGALHILDRFHIMAHLSKAIDEVRAQEARELKEKGYEPILTKTRWLLLKRPENLTAKQDIKLPELLQYNLKSIRSYLLKEEFQLYWQYTIPYWAGEFLEQWRTKTMRSKIEAMKRVAKMLKRHRPLLLNWFRAKKKFSSGIIEGFNTKAKVTTRKAYGFRTYHAAEIALYHTLGALPVPETVHDFF